MNVSQSLSATDFEATPLYECSSTNYFSPWNEGEDAINYDSKLQLQNTDFVKKSTTEEIFHKRDWWPKYQAEQDSDMKGNNQNQII